MIVSINSYPGVGKLTIGRVLAKRLGGKLLDNHSIYNVAFALTEFRSEVFYKTVREVRDIAYRRVIDIPAGVPVILTNWYSADSEWGVENWQEIILLASRRGCALYNVILSCAPDENARRIQDRDRAIKRKPQDPAMVSANRAGRPLLDHGGDSVLRLDVTHLSAEIAAAQIADWIDRQN